jgi:hypothetical protein
MPDLALANAITAATAKAWGLEKQNFSRIKTSIRVTVSEIK